MVLPGSISRLILLGHNIEPSQVQPAGVDLRVGEIHVFRGPGLLGLEERELPPTERLEANNGVWFLRPGAYKVRFLEAVMIPPTSVGFCFPRSSLLRMGAVLHCTVWDPGYRGRGEGLLVVFNEHGIKLSKGARVAQLVLLDVTPPNGIVYRGFYQNENL